MQKSVDVLEGDTPWVLGGRVFAEETKLLINAIRFLKGKVHRCDTTSM
jgi:folate-dependent phosphoribosylglycinamide formyltransferase PurN